MKVLNERQSKILESLETKKYVSVNELSDKLKVSVVTIRKDIVLTVELVNKCAMCLSKQ